MMESFLYIQGFSCSLQCSQHLLITVGTAVVVRADTSCGSFGSALWCLTQPITLSTQRLLAVTPSLSVHTELGSVAMKPLGVASHRTLLQCCGAKRGETFTSRFSPGNLNMSTKHPGKSQRQVFFCVKWRNHQSTGRCVTPSLWGGRLKVHWSLSRRADQQNDFYQYE